MLPSTGYFKGINCPFYDSGLCERPYCHFRHVKKELQNINDGIESGTILQKLVSAAVQKVLQQTESSGTSSHTQVSTASDIPNINNVQPVLSKATYNPTPIAELNKINNLDAEILEDVNEQRKRHIPVPYTPRKPTTLSIKRPDDSNGSLTYIPIKYTPGSTENAQLDPYTPKGTIESNEKYLPGKETELQEYKPKETQLSNRRNYVPSDKSVNYKKILEYKPTKVKTKSEAPLVTYKPTPRELAPCFSSDEDEPEIKKRKLSSDLNGLDDLGPEFDILDQILDEEKIDDDKNIKKHTTVSSKLKEKNEISDKTKKNTSKCEVVEFNKMKTDETKKSNNKTTQNKTSQNSSNKDKASHKSSSKDKYKDRSEKKSHSHSSSSEHNSKHKKSSSNDSKSSKEIKKESHHQKTHKSSKHSKEKHKKKNSDKKKSVKVHDEDHNLESLENLSDLSEPDEESIALECKRIFEEYVPTEKPKHLENIINKQEDIVEANDYIPGKKRISRTSDKNIKIIPKTPIKPNFKVNAAQTMAERLAKIKEYHASKTHVEAELLSKQNITKNTFTAPIVGNTKIRIAHVPYASTLVNAKKTIPQNVENNNITASTSSITAIQTVKKGTQRVAHVPNEKFIDRPGVLEPLASKIPANIRSVYLNMMIDECLKIYLSATDAYARAQHEELTTSKKCSTIQIYKNSAVLTVSRLRKELKDCNGVKKSSSDCSTLQKIPETLSGKSGGTGSWSIKNKTKTNFDDSTQFSGLKLYNNIKKWVLTEEQLQENGFPRPHSSGEKGRAVIFGQKKQIPPKGLIRTCCRCKKDFTVDKKGFPATKAECIYHPNNKYRIRGEVRYQCCSQDGTSDGCCIASCHVYEYVDYDNLKGYVKTLPPDKDMEYYGVYSLDCEMCYTTHGLDLTRVTVINSTCKVVYETLVKPLHPIIDYNTRYSGITEEQMLEVTTSLLEVQATLLTMFNCKTILVGHSLESDFKALKLIHDTVIDTSVLFPHKMGPPYKRALRNLTSEHLKKIIQNSVDGHDSAEDATVCMELLLYKLKEDLKTR